MPPSLGGAVLPFALGSAVAVGACYYYSLLRKSRDEAADAKAVDGLPEDFIPTAPMPSRSVSAPPSVGFRPLPPPAEAVSTTNDEEEELIEDDGSDIGIDFDKLLSLEHMREFDAVCAQELQRVTKEQMFNRMRKVAMELTKPERDAISQQIIVRAFAHRMSRKLIDKGKFSADRFKKLASAAGVTQRDYQLKHLWLFITKRLRTFTCRQLSGLFNELGMYDFSLQRDLYELACAEAGTSPMLRRFIRQDAIREAYARALRRAKPPDCTGAIRETMKILAEDPHTPGRARKTAQALGEMYEQQIAAATVVLDYLDVSSVDYDKSTGGTGGGFVRPCRVPLQVWTTYCESFGHTSDGELPPHSRPSVRLPQVGYYPLGAGTQEKGEGIVPEPTLTIHEWDQWQVLEDRMRAYSGALASYQQSFLKEPSYEAMIRMLALEVSELGRGLHMLDAILQGRGRHDKATSQRAGAPPPAPVDEATRRALQDGAAEAIVQCAKLMTILAGGVTHQLIELGGGDQSLDFWTFSIALEVACLGQMEGVPKWKTLVRLIVSCVRRAPYPGALGVTASRLAATAQSFEAQAKYDESTGLDLAGAAALTRDAIELLNEGIDAKVGGNKALDHFIEEVESSGASPSFKAYREGFAGSSRRRATSVLSLFRRQTSAVWKMKPTAAYVDHFLTGTFNFRGLVGAARPRFTPGGLSLVGARVPDMIFSRADERNYGQLLHSWALTPTIEISSAGDAPPTTNDVEYMYTAPARVPTPEPEAEAEPEAEQVPVPPSAARRASLDLQIEISDGGEEVDVREVGTVEASAPPLPASGHEPFHPTTRQFVADVTRRVRAAFSTWLLQDLHSPEHAKFDTSSDALIELLGISRNDRKGVNATSNASLSLLFFGDCREHASEMIAFFSFRQMLMVGDHCRLASEKLLGPLNRASKHAERLAKDAAKMTSSNQASKTPTVPSLPPLPVADLASAKQHVAECARVLNEELRGGHVAVYAEVAMVEKYVEEHPPADATTADGESVASVPLLRGWTPGMALTPYELGYAFLLLTYEDGSRLLLDANPSDWQLPNKDGVPFWPETHPESNAPLLPFAPAPGHVSGVSLFALIEEHTMTFLFKHATKETPAAIARADAFYNEVCSAEEVGPDGMPRPRKFSSPYEFGCGVVSLDDGHVQCVRQSNDGPNEWQVYAPPSAACVLLDGGTLEAASPVEGAGGGTTYELVRTPVWLRPCGFSRRSDAPALSELGQSLSMIGCDLGQVDVALELAREDAEHSLNLPSRRDMFIERLIAWHKIQRAKG